MRICVAIPTYMRGSVLLDTISGVLEQDRLADEILVIDQPKHDESVAAELQRLQDEGRIRWIRHSPPNTPGARNRALRETTCDIILYLDDDVILPHDLVTRHLANYENPEVAAIAGRVLQPPKKRTRSSWPPYMDAVFFDFSSEVRKQDIAAFFGCNHSARVSALKSIGGYDEDFGVGSHRNEESDAAVRLWKAGYRIDFDPSAYLTHLNTPSGGYNWNGAVPLHLECYTNLYFAFRHWYPTRWFWESVFIKMFRGFVFNKATLSKPWRLPRATILYWYAVFLTWRKWVQTGRSSQDITDRKGGHQ
jgi:GT2 family glycosyltransferase